MTTRAVLALAVAFALVPIVGAVVLVVRDWRNG